MKFSCLIFIYDIISICNNISNSSSSYYINFHCYFLFLLHSLIMADLKPRLVHVAAVYKATVYFLRLPAGKQLQLRFDNLIYERLYGNYTSLYQLHRSNMSPVATNTLLGICKLNGDQFRPSIEPHQAAILQEIEYTYKLIFGKDVISPCTSR